MARSRDELTGRRKAAILLVALGTQKAAQIYKYLDEEEIEQLTLEIASIRKVDPEVKEKVVTEFYEICQAQEYIAKGGIDYAKDILEKALGNEKALQLIHRITSSLQVRPFDFVKNADPNQLLNFIQYEHPQTIALILSYLSPSQASAILSSLPPEKQPDVAARIAVMDRTSPEIIKEVERVLEKKLSSLVAAEYASVGGIQAIVDILNSVDRGTEKHILDDLEARDEELVEEIKRRMFVFEDIINLDNRAIQAFLREVDNDDLTVALKGTSQEVADVIFNNMSKRLQEIIKEDMELMGPVRLRDVEEAQQKIVNVIRRLEDQGEIIIARNGGDEIIV